MSAEPWSESAFPAVTVKPTVFDKSQIVGASWQKTCTEPAWWPNESHKSTECEYVRSSEALVSRWLELPRARACIDGSPTYPRPSVPVSTSNRLSSTTRTSSRSSTQSNHSCAQTRSGQRIAILLLTRFRTPTAALLPYRHDGLTKHEHGLAARVLPSMTNVV